MATLSDKIRVAVIKLRNIRNDNPKVKLSVDDISNIREGIQDNNIVNFIYTRQSDGRTGLYQGVEPYEISGGTFWGFHKKHGTIHNFRLSRIKNVRKTNVKFEKREF
jgi:predicted DNA-binding transcriptional regulator YafY